MSTTYDAPSAAVPEVLATTAGSRRVRHEVRDGAVLMVFSALASSGLAATLVLLPRVLG